MSDRMSWRERSAWLAVVVGLAISLGWIAAVCTVTVLQSHAIMAPALALARALSRVVVALALRAWPILPLGVLGGMMLVPAVRTSAPARGKVRHV